MIIHCYFRRISDWLSIKDNNNNNNNSGLEKKRQTSEPLAALSEVNHLGLHSTEEGNSKRHSKPARFYWLSQMVEGKASCLTMATELVDVNLTKLTDKKALKKSKKWTVQKEGTPGDRAPGTSRGFVCEVPRRKRPRARAKCWSCSSVFNSEVPTRKWPGDRAKGWCRSIVCKVPKVNRQRTKTTGTICSLVCTDLVQPVLKRIRRKARLRERPTFVSSKSLITKRSEELGPEHCLSWRWPWWGPSEEVVCEGYFKRRAHRQAVWWDCAENRDRSVTKHTWFRRWALWAGRRTCTFDYGQSCSSCQTLCRTLRKVPSVFFLAEMELHLACLASKCTNALQLVASNPGEPPSKVAAGEAVMAASMWREP